jgi:hypothetical protein
MVALPPQYRPPREAFMAGRMRPSGVTTSYSGIACAQKSGLRACTITCARRPRWGGARPTLPYPSLITRQRCQQPADPARAVNAPARSPVARRAV